MKYKPLSLVLLATCGCSTTPVAPPKPPPLHTLQGPGPYNFDCDVPGGHFRYATIPVPHGAFEVDGLAEWVQARYSNAWESTVVVALGPTRDGAMGPQDELIVVGQQSSAREYVYRLGHAPRLYASAVFAGITAAPAAFRFKFTVTGSGESRVAISGLWAPATLTVTHLNWVELACSGAHVKFTGVTILSEDSSAQDKREP